MARSLSRCLLSTHVVLVVEAMVESELEEDFTEHLPGVPFCSLNLAAAQNTHPQCYCVSETSDTLKTLYQGPHLPHLDIYPNAQLYKHLHIGESVTQFTLLFFKKIQN